MVGGIDGYPISGANNLQPGIYYNFIVTFDGSIVKLYRNGELEGTNNYVGTIPQSTSDIMIGEYDQGGNYYFDGIIDDIRIYNRALSEAEILQLYNEESSLDRFSFSAISYPQTVEVPFEVTVTAMNQYGGTFPFNGDVCLSSSMGNIAPLTANLSNGSWTGDVTLYEAGIGIYLSATSGGITGNSNSFDITGQGTNLGYLQGTVRDTEGNLIESADVYLSREKEGPSVYATIATTGRYELNEIECGQYYIWSQHDGAKSQTNEVSVPCDRCVTQDLIISYCNPDGRIPILLVPGILGSDSIFNIGYFYPILPKNAPSWDSGKLILHDPWGMLRPAPLDGNF